MKFYSMPDSMKKLLGILVLGFLFFGVKDSSKVVVSDVAEEIDL